MSRQAIVREMYPNLFRALESKQIKSAYLSSWNEDFDEVAKRRGGILLVHHNQNRSRTTIFKDEFDKYDCYTRIDGQYGVREP